VDEPTFNTLYGATAKPLWRYIARVSGSDDVADDVLQECYYRLLKSERADMALADARPYLFRIATNLMNDRWRRGLEVSLESGFAPATESDAENAVDAVMMLGRLKPRARQLLWLAYMEGMTHREIAGVTGLNVMSVRVLLLRARRDAQALIGRKEKAHA
jgi:RNA polymerase sigma-70 factor (ECF subfamily)